MKKTVYFIVVLVLICVGCQKNKNTLFGNWKADKVEVDFDERHSTPEIVKQTGIVEKENQLIITADSSLTFISQGDTVKGSFSIREAQVFLKGRPFGTVIEKGITTVEETPFGNITVTYRKVR